MTRLRVGIPPLLGALPPNTSVHRIWSEAIRRISQQASVRLVDPDGRPWRRRRVDVWLTDGHQGALNVSRPVVAHFHEASWDLDEVTSTSDPAFVAHYRALSAASAARATRILTVSNSSKDQIVASYGVDPSIVHVVHNGVDLSLHRPGLTGGGQLVAAAGGVADRPYVLFVGTVHPRKNLSVLREAMARLHADGLPHALVLVAGPSADRADSDELLAQAQEPIGGQPVVNLAGIDDRQLAQLMAGADALCLPSLMEGFGMPVIEAMACGTPVVVSDRGALPEVVGDAGVVTPPTADAIARGLSEILTDEELASGLAGRGVRRAQAFGWDSMVDEWLRVLREAADTR